MTPSKLGRLPRRAGARAARAVSLEIAEREARRRVRTGTVLRPERELLRPGIDLEDYLLELRSRDRPLLFTAWDGVFLERLATGFPAGLTASRQRADAAVASTFDILGSDAVRLGDGLDWHLDFKSGKSFHPVADRYFKRIQMNCVPGADILVPWWLSSFYHLVHLGKAFVAEREDSVAALYASNFVRQVSHWTESNPYPFGVNWASCAIVSIRLVHWIWGFYFFRKSPDIPSEFWETYLHQIHLHGRHVRENLEWFPVRTNHYLTNLAALLYVGILFPELREAAAWQEFARAQLNVEIDHHALPDGVVHEGSLNYHRFVTEIFLSCMLLAASNGLEFPRSYRDRLVSMLEFVRHYTAPDGSAPRVGDGAPILLQDLGQPDPVGDHRWLLGVGAALFRRADFKEVTGEPPEALLWLLGVSGLDAYERLRPQPRSIGLVAGSRSFPDGGVHVIRDRDSYLLFRCGPLPMEGVRGHWHYDVLSFELWLGGEPVLIDPGWFCYEADEDEMRRFKSTACHNTLSIDGLDQVRDDRFVYPPPLRPQPRLLEFRVEDETATAIGEHSLYERLTHPVTHRRGITYSRPRREVQIEDTLGGRGTHLLEWTFHFAPSVAVDLRGREAQFRTPRLRGRVVPEQRDVQPHLAGGWAARGYGRRHSTTVLRYRARTSVPATFSFVVTSVGTR